MKKILFLTLIMFTGCNSDSLTPKSLLPNEKISTQPTPVEVENNIVSNVNNQGGTINNNICPESGPDIIGKGKECKQGKVGVHETRGCWEYKWVIWEESQRLVREEGYAYIKQERDWHLVQRYIGHPVRNHYQERPRRRGLFRR